MKKKLLITAAIILGLGLLIIGAVWYMNTHFLSVSVGRVLISDSAVMLVRDDAPTVMTDRTGNRKLFDSITDGDKVLVLHGMEMLSYPGQTDVYAMLKLKDGNIADISDTVLDSLAAMGWKTAAELVMPEMMSEDFSFALHWGCYGISSYDSKTGKLVKTADSTHPADYITTYTLQDDAAQHIYESLYALDINDYPEIYDPQEGKLATSPPLSLILTVRIGDREKTIRADNIAYAYEADNKKGQRFLTVCREIVDLLTDSEEWKALPDYEFYYD